MFLPEKIHLVDHGEALVRAWEEVFEEYELFEVHQGDYFSQDADAMVSPANSFGIMDGGLDLAIRDNVGFQTEDRLQKLILNEFHGELPIGNALIVETETPRWPYLIAAPTMRVPMDVSNTLNAYLAFRAILLVVQDFNRNAGKRLINSLVCSGLGTGSGNMPARKCAAQMRIAYLYLSKPARIPSFQAIHEVHRKLSVVV